MDKETYEALKLVVTAANRYLEQEPGLPFKAAAKSAVHRVGGWMREVANEYDE